MGGRRWMILLHILVICALLLGGVGAVGARPLRAQGPSPSVCGPDGTLPSGAVYRICMPALGWNGDLVIYAHGYVTPTAPIAIPEAQLRLPDGTYVPDMVTSLGYAFATTSYHRNGLAVQEGIADILELVGRFNELYGEACAAQFGRPVRVYLAGVSEGGLVTTLAVERNPGVFRGGLAICGPIGDFRRQINHVGDTRVLFDYFFPGILPGTAITVPQQLRDNWSTYYEPLIAYELRAHPARTRQLLTVAKLPVDPLHPVSSGVGAVLGVLWYNVYGTEDAKAELDGQPFDNHSRIYRGSANDARLNRLVARYSADPAARVALQAYQTTGALQRPLVTLHNVGDPIVPYWHEALYRSKTVAAGTWLLYANIPVLRYGHSNVTAPQVLGAFSLLVQRASALP